MPNPFIFSWPFYRASIGHVNLHSVLSKSHLDKKKCPQGRSNLNDSQISLGHAVDSFEAVLKNYIIHVGGDHTITVPYKVRGDHKIPIPFQVWVDHKSHWQLQEDHMYMWGDHTILVPYKAKVDHQIIYMGGHIYMWGTIQYLFHMR